MVYFIGPEKRQWGEVNLVYKHTYILIIIVCKQV